MPGIGLTIAIYLLVRALINVLFPTFGLPTIDILTPYLAVWSCFEAYSTFINFIISLFILFFALSSISDPICGKILFLRLIIQIK